MEDRSRVFVVHGRDSRLRGGMFALLRALGLEPLEWSKAVELTGKASPYIGEILEAAFTHARAVVVLLTPDDEARLREDLLTSDDPQYERILTRQARPNVLFEAGMAFASHPEQTILVQFGSIRPFSDIAGRHVVRMDDSSVKRQELASRLKAAGCSVDTSGTEWLSAGSLAPPSGSNSERTYSTVPSRGTPGDRPTETEAKIIRLNPRLCSISQNYEETGHTFFEYPQGMKAVVIPFRIQIGTNAALEATVTARVAYFDSEKQLVQRVDYGCWLSEDYNSVPMGVRDTKELILAVESGEQKVMVVQDNRHGTTRNFGCAPKELQGREFYADVSLIQEETGAIGSYAFRLESTPLKAFPLITLPRAVYPK